MGNSGDRFAWFGQLEDQDLEFVQILMEDLANAKLQDRFLICDQVDQFAAGLDSADAVLLTQRPGCEHSFIADADWFSNADCLVCWQSTKRSSFG